MTETQERKGPLGIFVGKGDLPWIAARNAQKAGEDIRIFCMEISEVPEEFRSLSEGVIMTKFYSSVLTKLRRHKIKRIIALGKVTRDVVYKKGYDLRFLLQFLRARSQSDHNLFLLTESILKKNNIEVLPQNLFLGDLSLEEGRYGNKLNSSQLRDVEFGLQHARIISQMNIGQTVVVGDRAILAVEAAEGSDQCIERGGKIFIKSGKGAAVCKLPAKNHDMRFDIPTVGVETLETMQRSDCRVIAFDAKRTFVVEPEIFLKKAKQHSISILAMDSKKREGTYLGSLNAKGTFYSPKKVEPIEGQSSSSAREDGSPESSV